MARAFVFLACLLSQAAPAYAQAPTSTDPVDALVRRLERVLNAGDRTALPTLFSPSVPPAVIEQHALDLFVAGAIRTAIFERSRGPLEGVPAGDGFRLVVELFIETSGRARIISGGLDVRRPTGGDAESWRISSLDSMSAVGGLYKLRLNTSAPVAVRNLELRSEDVVVALQDGLAFRIECDEGVTGLILLGRGELRFSPAPAAERSQLRIFAGTESLAVAFETAYVRINPRDYEPQMATAVLGGTAPSDERAARRAMDVFRRQSALSFRVDVAEMSRDQWHLLPQAVDFLADVDTRRFDTLTYLRSNQQAEDVSLFRRADRRTIALYPSVAKLAARGRFYSDDTSREYDVLDYGVSASIDPRREFIRGRARLSMRIRSTSVPTLLLRLADSLAVTAVSSVEYGRLLHLRIEGQNMIAVNLPRPVHQDSDLTLVIDYAGRVESQNLDIDTVQADTINPDGLPPAAPAPAPEPKYLLSNRSFWYPQNPIPDYATASLRITVPDNYRCVGSGEATATSLLAPPADDAGGPNGRTFAFRANQPLPYLAVVVSRMVKVAESRIEFPGDTPMILTIDANPQQQDRGRALLRPAEDILRFYAALVGDAPYASSAIALTESDLPGGHSPAYFSLLNEPRPPAAASWRGDPAAFTGFPDFFLAHELAHQWWGQAVGWKNYHEQWLSEGFSQYFAALYAQKTRGDRVFVDMLRQFRRSALDHSSQGPVFLGYRLGHLKSDLRVFRALVYNKGAAVLHMLRRLLGDEVFFTGLRLFYEDRRYQKAGTEDLERSMEAASGRVLDRFFDRWIYNSDIPLISYRATIAAGTVTVEFEQTGSVVFDVPVTVRLVHTNGEATEVVVPVTDAQVVRAIDTATPVREVQINRDFAALAEFDEK